MRYPLAVLCVCCVLVAPAVAQTEVTSTVESVTVYPDGATVTRVIRVDLPQGDAVVRARDFPPELDPASLRIEGEAGARLMIGGIDARPPRAERPPVDPALENKMEALRDESDRLGDRIAAAEARKKFVMRFAEAAPAGLGEKGEARPLAEWRAAFGAVAEEIATADVAIREAQQQQRAIRRELAQLEAERKANPPRKMEVRIDLSADAATSATLRVSYSVRGARWSPIYDARLDSGTRDRKPSLELVRRAEIVQSTGEDWPDVQLSVSTVRTGKGGNAPELRPLIVRYPSAGGRGDGGVLLGSSDRPAPRAAAPASQDVRRERLAQGQELQDVGEREATIEAGGFQAVFRIAGRISVAANEGAKSFRISGAAIAPELQVRAAPAVDSTGFLEAVYKHGDDAPLLPGRVAIYRDGIFVGRGQMALYLKGEEVRLGFGADEKIKIARTTVRQNAGSAGIISSSKTDEREYKVAVHNGHDRAIRITIEESIPVSETEDVKVELLPAMTAPTERDVRNKRGVLAWRFEAAPDESRDIRIAWRVRWPADKAVVYAPGQ